ncbi:VOC family protein [Tsukamurella pseudospumae]|uniref:Glyoxalase/fosfomycin resistance/dioxygenase domain-containing protein n=1 Tax=Tsukamurella pseudospumae TaxID=239498 RepID=A0A138AEL3_9ACTN|nr:VOC family protein [Tsukamurella pseudospumae]KXP08819.1 hypothetical protein AXK60_09145 [Tsukamurella pseudospumae]
MTGDEPTRTFTDIAAGGHVEFTVSAAVTDAEIDRLVASTSEFHMKRLHDAVDVAADGWKASWTAAVIAERDRCKPGHSRTHHAHWAAGGGLAPNAADQRWIPLTVTSETSDAEIEALVAEAVARRAADQHREVEVEGVRWRTRWRRELELLRHELGGPEPAPVVAGDAVAGPPCPMPGRMRTWTTPEGMWLQWIDRTHPMDLDQAQAQRVPVAATDTDEKLAAAAERWLSGYGCPPAGSAKWILPQLRAYRDRLAEDVRWGRQALAPRPMTPEERARIDAAVSEAREWAAAAMRARRVPRLSTLVLYVSDVEASAEWYRAALGIQWTRERHGGGPEHVSAQLGEVLVEIYPAGDRAASRVRIELVVPDMYGGAEQAPDPFPRRLTDLDGTVIVVNLR